jgi:AraC-like DNA-binding protein
MNFDFERLARAVCVLNTVKLPPLAFDRLQVRYRHWGVTPPAYWRSQHHPNPCETHKHPYYEICHAWTGRGKFSAFEPDAQWEVNAGDTFFARPGLLHHYGSALSDPLGICFWSILIESRRAAAGTSSESIGLLQSVNGGALVVRGNSRTAAVLTLIFDEALSGGQSERLAPLLRYLTLSFGARSEELNSPRARGDASRAGVNLGRLGQYLQDHCHRNLKIAEVAARSGYSSRHLARLFTQQYGESFSDYLMRVRIQTASHLLLDDTVSLKQIARKAGFNSMPAFVRSFRRFTGVTPGAYRQRSLGAAQ